jgi:hypothetical protein
VCQLTSIGIAENMIRMLEYCLTPKLEVAEVDLGLDCTISQTFPSQLTYTGYDSFQIFFLFDTLPITGKIKAKI